MSDKVAEEYKNDSKDTRITFIFQMIVLSNLQFHIDHNTVA